MKNRGLIFLFALVILVGSVSALTYDSSLTDISDCGTINEPGNYTLQNNISVSGDCLTINANGVFIEGNGFSLNGDSISGTGIVVKNRYNLTLVNFGVIGFYKGITLKNVSNSLLSNLYIFNNALSGIFIYSNSLNNIIQYSNISGGSSGVVLSFSNSNEIIESSILTLRDFDISNSISNDIINSSFLSEIVDSSSNLSVFNYLSVNASLTGANVSVYNSSGSLVDSALTDSNGLSNFLLQEYFDNGSINYVNNYTLNVNKSGFIGQNVNISINGSTQRNVSLVAIPVPTSSGTTSLASVRTTGGSGGGNCYVDWACTIWSPCANGLQTRICNLPQSSCFPNGNKPVESQTCSTTNPAENISANLPQNVSSTENVSSGTGITGAVIGGLKNPGIYIPLLFIGLLIASFIALTIFRNSKKKNN